VLFDTISSIFFAFSCSVELAAIAGFNVFAVIMGESALFSIFAIKNYKLKARHFVLRIRFGFGLSKLFDNKGYPLKQLSILGFYCLFNRVCLLEVNKAHLIIGVPLQTKTHNLSELLEDKPQEIFIPDQVHILHNDPMFFRWLWIWFLFSWFQMLLFCMFCLD
jgi:hypothetical protein